MQIKFSIISRGSMLIQFMDKTVKISGELVASSAIFYADINAFQNWDVPNENEKITIKERNKIINYVTEASLKAGNTRVIFD